MPISSYLVHPHNGKKNELFNALSSFDNCEVIPAENKDLLILVTDTASDLEEDSLRKEIEAIKSLKLMAMVAGFNSPKNN